jgi:hypothetical protein
MEAKPWHRETNYASYENVQLIVTPSVTSLAITQIRP